VLLGADPLADLPDADLARRGLAGARRVIALDGHLSGSAAEHADVVLPAAVMAEKSGTTTNLEGRVSSVAQKVTVHGTSRPDWMVAVELGIALGCDLGVASLEEITGRLAEGGAADGSLWTGIIPAAPLVVVPAVGADGYSMRLVLSRVLYDGAVSTRLSPSLAPLAGGPGVSIHPLDMERLGVGAADEVRLSTDRASISLPACPDDRLDRGTIWIPFGQQGGDPRELISGSAVTDVRIERMS
jgi:NADH-quinone oxidoreductase subunit G